MPWSPWSATDFSQEKNKSFYVKKLNSWAYLFLQYNQT